LFPIAHVASAMLLNRLLYRDSEVPATALGALVPDAVDKPLAWVLRVTPSSHYVAHTPLAGAALSLVVARLWGLRAARAFGSAYLSHLLIDDLHHGRVPWLLPASQYRRLPRRRSPWLFAIGVLGEIPALALIMLLLKNRGRAGGSQSARDVRPEGSAPAQTRADLSEPKRNGQRSNAGPNGHAHPAHSEALHLAAWGDDTDDRDATRAPAGLPLLSDWEAAR
jgi:hypothetical protein